jgi:hypothetical protein
MLESAKPRRLYKERPVTVKMRRLKSREKMVKKLKELRLCRGDYKQKVSHLFGERFLY